MKHAAPIALLALLAACAFAPTPAPVSKDGPVARPEVATWVTLGTTLRLAPTDPFAPNQFRHVQVAPETYKALLANGAWPDGAVFAVTFHSAIRDEGEKPTLYAEGAETAFALEALDRAHPDGRRFYSFANGAVTAQPLPAGNSCATCHNARGGFQGTFAQHYPLVSKYAAPKK